MDMLTPEGFQQSIFGPGVIGGGHAFTGVVSPIAARPECVNAGSSSDPNGCWGKESGERHQPSLPESAEERVSRSTVRAAS